jgi:ribonucleoside-diphosphate reductase beta chain
MEPLLDTNNRRFTLFPIQHQDIWELYQTQLASFWKAEEIDMSKDYTDFLTLSENEQFYIKRILAFFASSDGLINFNISTRFQQEVTCMEALVCYQFQVMMENIHSTAYSLMLDNIVKDPEEKHLLFNSMKTVPSVKTLADWALKWTESEESFAHRLVVFCGFEAIIFSGTFASIFWLKSYKSVNGAILNGLVNSNAFISRDEGMHVQFGVMLYKKLQNKLPQSEVYKIVKEATELSKNFMTEALPCKLIGMNSESMCEYIEYVADRLIVDLGYEKIYKTQNPYPWMSQIGMVSKTNFFEARANQYQSTYGMGRVKEDLKILDDF